MMRRPQLFPVLLLLASLLMSGCLWNRSMLRFGDHPTQPGVIVKTMDEYFYLFYFDTHVQYWQCAETDAALNCTRTCRTDGTGIACSSDSLMSTGPEVR
jgi:hypothetical protein